MSAKKSASSGRSIPAAKVSEHPGQGPITVAQPIAVSGIVDAILEVCRQRNLLLNKMRHALESGENEIALALAGQLCGFSNEESNRTDSRIN